jgi:hypothetical protein
VTPTHPVWVNGLPAACHAFNLDLYRVRAGEPTTRVAGRLQTDRGVTVIPDQYVDRFPRLPVLGVRCLCASRVTFAIDGGRRTFTLRGPG